MPENNSGLQTTNVGLEVEALLEKLKSSPNIPESLREKAMFMLERVDNLIKSSNYSEYESISNYINWICRIPFRMYTRDNLDIQNVSKQLDELHYGLNDIKDSVLEFLSIMKLRQSTNTDGEISMGDDSRKSPALLFLGIQGVGKTTMAKSISKALGRRFIRISLGGMASIDELRGISRTSPQAEPGQIIKALVKNGSMNPVILLDEIDKVSESRGTRQDVMAALLEILDPEQNYAFTDRYIDSPIDISKCLFIVTANNTGGISAALMDRLDVVRFTSYNDEDKAQIGKNYLLSKIRVATGLDESKLSFSDDVWPLIIRPLGFDAGIRGLERTLVKISRKVAKQIVEGEFDHVQITPQNFREYIPDDFGVYT